MKDSPEPYRLVCLLEQPLGEQLPVLRCLPANNCWLCAVFSGKLPARAEVLEAASWHEVSTAYKERLEQKPQKLRFTVDFPVRFFYKRRFARILYPCVLLAGLLSFCASVHRIQFLPPQEFKQFIAEAARELKPVELQGEIVNFRGMEYVRGRFVFRVSPSWQYYHLAVLAEVLCRYTLASEAAERLRSL